MAVEPREYTFKRRLTRGQPVPMSLKIHPDLHRKLDFEAKRQGKTPAALASRLLETIIKDNLYAAVLDDDGGDR